MTLPHCHRGRHDRREQVVPKIKATDLANQNILRVAYQGGCRPRIAAGSETKQEWSCIQLPRSKPTAHDSAAPLAAISLMSLIQNGGLTYAGSTMKEGIATTTIGSGHCETAAGPAG
jgi:hypothetical protein